MSDSTCLKCALENRPGAQFCRACGHPLGAGRPGAAALPLVCPQCSQKSPTGTSFCTNCGYAFAPRPAPVRPAAARPGRKKSGFASPWLWAGVVVVGLLSLACLATVVAGGYYFFQQNNRGVILDHTPAVVPVESGRDSNANASPPQPTRTPRSQVGGSATPALPPTAPRGPEPTLTPVVIPGLGIEIPHISDEEEIEIGREVAGQIEDQYRVSRDQALLAHVEGIANRILPNTPRRIQYTFAVLDTREINAFAAPGGFIYVTTGLMDFVESDDELAGVIGHEIAHITLRHGAQQIEALAAAEAALEAILGDNPEFETIYEDQTVLLATQIAYVMGSSGWSRQAELDADQYGTIYMAAAGYDPHAMINLLARLGEMEEVSDDAIEQLFATHPPAADRIARVEQTIADNGLR